MGCHVVKSIVSVKSQQNYRNCPDGMDNNKDIEGDTQPQTQSQSTNAWTNMDSQPIEQLVWGRLYPKSVKVNSLGRCISPKAHPIHVDAYVKIRVDTSVMFAYVFRSMQHTLRCRT